MTDRIVNVMGLNVSYKAGVRRKPVRAVQNVSFTVDAGEVVALVGESGSGKTTIAKTLLGLLPGNAIVTGNATVADTDIIGLKDRQWVRLRRSSIGYIPQDPGASLNPTMTVGRQVEEAYRIIGIGRGEARREAISLLTEVGFPDAERRYGQYPFELSGGLAQRVLIAIALARNPRFIVADEPTSALDVTVQKVIIRLLKRLVEQRRIGMLLITHDLAVAREIAGKVLVMQQGRLVESGGLTRVVGRPEHEYTRRLVEAYSTFEFDPSRHAGTADVVATNPVLSWEHVSKDYGQAHVIRDVSLTVHAGETLGVVGESGSGKSTLLRLALGLSSPTSGRIMLGGRELNALGRQGLREMRSFAQLVQQNPYSSVDPRYTVLQAVSEPLIRQHRKRRVKDCEPIVRSLLERVELGERVLHAKTRDLSGGQIQRVAIARALSCSPKLILLDEPVSALDVLVQARVLELLDTLKHELSLTYVFVSHDIGVIQNFSDRIAVVHQGRIVETGATSQVLEHPEDAYTRLLIDSIPGTVGKETI